MTESTSRRRDPVNPVERRFVTAIEALRGGPSAAGVDGADDRLSAETALELFDSYATSRHLDLAARRLRAEGRGFYTIGSSGHESNGVVAAATRVSDPALLHYRSGGFYVQRARRAGVDAVRDVLLGLVAAAEDPISGGRHKVFGRRELNVIPQTSTIASHLPRAVGVAVSMDLAARLGVPSPWPEDAVVVCSFGDASANHSTAVGAINAAVNTAYRGIPTPLLFVCEDNGIGISTKTPRGWIERGLGDRDGLEYVAADGADLPGSYAAACWAAEYVRRTRRPALLHLRTVRLMGHAGSDYEAAYRTPSEIAADEARDPVLAAACWLVVAGVLTPDDVLDRYEAVGERVAEVADDVARLPRLAGAAAIAGPLTAAMDEAVAATGDTGEADDSDGEPLTVALAINRALREILAANPGAVVFGEDVGRKGGVYGVTRGLQKEFGGSRVFDTILDEQAILGMGLGAGLSGLLPIAEIQYLAYLHNAADQIRGEGATLQYFSERRYRNPMIVRVAGYGYQKGFGGHFHNDNAVAALRDIPGIVIATPSRPDDAAAMLQACAAATIAAGVVCMFLEPIALYHTRDLHEPGDGAWLAPYPGSGTARIGEARVYGDGADLTIVTFGNGVPMSLRCARVLAGEGIGVRVVDLRWLAPLPRADVLREANATGRVLVVDETRRSGGVSEGVVTGLVDDGFRGAIARVTSADSFIPLGDAALDVLLSEEEILAAARRVVG